MAPAPVHDAKTWDWPLQAHDGLVKIHDGRSFFEVSLDAQEYSPDEIDVKVTGDEVVIHLKREVKFETKKLDVKLFFRREEVLPAPLPANSFELTICPRIPTCLRSRVVSAEDI